MRRINSIQILRAIACLLVLFVHIGAHNDRTVNQLNGAIGVDIFFVISGYIIAASIGRLPQEAATSTFLRNRFTRVAPYYYLLTLLYALCAWTYEGAVPTLQAWAASFLFVPRIGEDPILILGWSLNHEVFFYAFVGLALLFTRRIPWIAVAFAACVVGMHWLPKPVGALRAMAASINLEFLYGMLIYHFREKLMPVFRHPLWLALSAVLLLLVMRISIDIPNAPQFLSLVPAEGYYRDTIYLYHFPFTIPRGVFYGLPAALLAVALLAQESRLQHLSPRNVMLRIGDASFSIYLLQIFFLLYLPKSTPLWLLGISFLVCILLSVLIYPSENYLARKTKQLLIAVS